MREKILVSEKRKIAKREKKAQLFTLDVLLALIPLVIALGLSANAFSGLASQMQSYVFSYDAQRIANDVADTILKTPGYPVGWNESNIQTLGLASVENNFVYNHILNFSKITMLKNSANKSAFKQALKKTSHGKNIIIEINASDPDYNVKVMGYYDPNTGEWKITQDEDTIRNMLNSAENVFMVERKTRILTEFAGNATFIWNYTGNDIVQSSPVIGDINCDGINEVVVSTNSLNGGTAAFYPNGTLIWFYPTGRAFTSSPALVDLDGDCELEIIAGETKLPGENRGIPSNITALDADGSLMWNYTLYSGTWNGPVVADVDYDNQVEVIITDMYNNASTPGPDGAMVYVISGNNGSLEWNYSSCDLPTGVSCTNDRHRFKGGVLVADLDRDPINGLEIIAATDIGYVFALHAKTRTLYWLNNSDEIPPFSGTPKVHTHSLPAAADINNDGWTEVVYADKNNGVHVMNGTTGSYICHNKIGNVDKSAVAIADLDASNDGNLEFVVGFEDGYIRAFYNNCTLFWEHNTADEYGTSYSVESSPAIADIDDDCALEVVVGSGGECDPKKAGSCPSFTPDPSYVYILDAENGNVAALGEARGSLVSSPAIGDLNGDGDQEIVIGSDSGELFAFDVSGYGDAWPSYHQAEASMTPYSVWRTGEWTGSICGMVSGAYSTIEARARITADVKIYVW